MSAAALKRLDPRAKLGFLLAFIVATLHAATPVALGLCCATALTVALAVRLPGRDAWRAMVPLVPILVFTVALQVASIQQGDVLCQVGPVSITVQALWASARMVVALAALMVASISFMRCTATEDLMSALRWMLGPLSARGLRTSAFLLALSITLSFIPVLLDDFGQLKRAHLARHASFEGTVRQKLAAYARLVPPLLRSSFRHADGLAQAALSRGLSLGPATALHPLAFSRNDAACLLLAIALVFLAW